MIDGDDPFYLKFLKSNLPRWSEIADFRALAVIHSDEHRTLYTPKGGLKNAVSKI